MKLMFQGYIESRLKSSFRKIYCRYNEYETNHLAYGPVLICNRKQGHYNKYYRTKYYRTKYNSIEYTNTA
jgi:hypothetical protein